MAAYLAKLFHKGPIRFSVKAIGFPSRSRMALKQPTFFALDVATRRDLCTLVGTTLCLSAEGLTKKKEEMCRDGIFNEQTISGKYGVALASDHFVHGFVAHCRACSLQDIRNSIKTYGKKDENPI